MPEPLTCFKAYDVRGELNVNFDASICYRIGRAFARSLRAKQVVLGHDARETSPMLESYLSQGLIDEGVEVLNIGLSGTEEMYWATAEYGACGGIEITASHNPINYNGLKMVKSGAHPLDPEAEFKTIKQFAEENNFGPAKSGGMQRQIGQAARQAYIAKLMSFLDVKFLKPLKIVVNSGNGAAGPSFDALASALNKSTDVLTFIRMFHEPDSRFPNGIPNPLLPENHAPTRDMVIETSADLGIAFDGDFDRCFFFDEKGRFIPGEYIVGLLSEVFLQKDPGAKIVHDPRVIWNTQDIVTRYGGTAIQSKTGHAFVKQTMRAHDAVYGGEISAHHYFRSFAYCDSGMIPWLLIIELMGRTGKNLSDLVAERMQAFPSSGEINFKLTDPKTSIKSVLNAYEPHAVGKDETDGISLSFQNWRFNLRSSNTEPVVRLNIESRNDRVALKEKIAEISALMAVR